MGLLSDHILSLIIFMPTMGALLCLVAPKHLCRRIAMLSAFLTLLLGVYLFKDYFVQQVGPDGAQQSIFGSSYGSPPIAICWAIN